MRWGADRDGIREQLDAIQRVLSSEVDYGAIAANLRTRRTALDAMSNVIAPRVHDALSATRVLTMDWIDGKHLPARVASQPTQNQRDRYGELLVRLRMRVCSGYRRTFTAGFWITKGFVGPRAILFQLGARFVRGAIRREEMLVATPDR